VAGKASPNLRLVHEPVLTTGGVELLAALRGALAALQANQEEINDLNVFPVPDGDTGSNMYLTLRSAVEEAADAADPSSAAAVLGAAAHGSLMGARGNSGVILSQVLRGLAQGVEGQARLDVRAWAHGFAEARAVAYKAVMKPTEGTILSIIREAAEEAERGADDTADIAALLERVVLASHAAVARTTEQLQVLRDAGVVDAGGFGLAVILDAMSRSIASNPATQAEARIAATTASPAHRSARRLRTMNAIPNGIAVAASPVLWIRSASSATDPEAMKTTSCTTAAMPSTSNASSTARMPSRERWIDRSIRPWLWPCPCAPWACS